MDEDELRHVDDGHVRADDGRVDMIGRCIAGLSMQVDERVSLARYLAATSRECRACSCFGSPCGGCSAGGVCDGMCQECERGARDDE